jgi:hypothetical protein
MGTDSLLLCASLFHNPITLSAARTYSSNITSSQELQVWLTKFEETKWLLFGSLCQEVVP